MNVEKEFIKYKKFLLGQGKTSYFQPDKIARQDIIDFLIISKKYASGLLLDIGCGDKSYRPIFSDTVTFHYGTDIPISISSNKLDKEIDFYADALRLPIKSGTIDTALLIQVLEHIPEPELLLKEIHRVLKKEKYLICSVPMMWGLHEEPYDYYRFTRYGLKYLSEKVGFEIVMITNHGDFFSTIGQLVSIGLFYHFEKRNFVVRSIVASFCGALQLISLFFDKIHLGNNRYSWGYGMVVKKIKNI